MSKKCARCEKTVYPIEELKCLDKIWHKQCFKCQVCNMTLNMRNYKGFNKQPYCEAHPWKSTCHCTRHLYRRSRFQNCLKDVDVLKAEKNNNVDSVRLGVRLGVSFRKKLRHIPKAKATTMAETPELKRIAENTKIQSNVLYHAEFEKAKGKFTQVADDPETLRIKQNSKIISNVAYHGELEKKAAMEQKRVMTGENGEPLPDADDLQMPPPPQVPPPAEPINHHHHHHHHQVPGKIADYDPLVEAPRNSPYSARQSATLIYTSDRGAVTSPPTRRVGSIADLDPVNNFYGSLSSDFLPPPGHGPPRGEPANHNNQHVVNTPIGNQKQQNKAPTAARVYKAMYDYDAQDSDEVSFIDGDLIVNCTPIDEGWMTGLVQRTGQTGMLPANYVEPVN